MVKIIIKRNHKAAESKKYMKKKGVAVFLCTVQLLLLSACQETPQEVRERMENYGDNNQISEDVELEYCTLEELKQTDLSGISDKYNVNIPEKTDFSQIEEINVLDMQYDSGCLERKDEYVRLFGIDEDTVKYIETDYDDDGVCDSRIYESDDKKARKYFCLDENGSISYISDTTYDYTEDKVTSVDTYATYDLSVDDVSEKTINFSGKPVPFTEVMDNAVAWAQEHFTIKGMDYRVLNLYERKLKIKGKTVPQLTLLLGHSYRGMLLEPYVSDSEEYGDKNQYTREKVSRLFAEFNCEDRDKYTFAALQGKYRLNSARKEEKVITPECALAIINKTFAGFEKIKASEFRAIYALFPSTETAEGEEKNVFKVEGRPVYAFWINKENQGIREFGISIIPEHYIYVDMITGEITTDYEIDRDDE